MSQTQYEMNANAHKKYQSVDAKLNQVYSDILAEYKTDSVFINNIKKSQKLWVQWRDAELLAKYPNKDTNEAGSVNPMCVDIFFTELTQARIKQLLVWIDGIEEGDVCGGSVKNK